MSKLEAAKERSKGKQIYVVHEDGSSGLYGTVLVPEGVDVDKISDELMEKHGYWLEWPGEVMECLSEEELRDVLTERYGR